MRERVPVKAERLANVTPRRYPEKAPGDCCASSAGASTGQPEPHLQPTGIVIDRDPHDVAPERPHAASGAIIKRRSNAVVRNRGDGRV